jgi:3-hydroxybutyrate dehydrogenase
MLQGKNVIVTGSTSGIGLGIAEVFAAHGCNIMFNGFGDKAEIDALVGSIAKQHEIKTAYSAADMSKPADVAGLVHDTKEQFGSVDVLINNAGIQFTSAIDNFPEEKWDAIIAINLSAAFHAMKAAIPLMKQQGYGRVINIASVHGLVASANKSAYVAAKHGLIGLTKAVALETAASGITVNAICPGWVLTPLVQKQIDDKAKAEGISIEEAQKKLLGEKEPTMRFTEPKHLGELAVFLCSEAGGNITGDAIVADGGWTAQ